MRPTLPGRCADQPPQVFQIHFPWRVSSSASIGQYFRSISKSSEPQLERRAAQGSSGAQELTQRHHAGVSTLLPKADIERREGNVSFVPQVDICSAANNPINLGVYWPNCMKPQIASSPATPKPTHETDMDTESGPICTAHRLIILTMWASATMAKISAVIAA